MAATTRSLTASKGGAARWRRSSTLTMCQPNWVWKGSPTSPFFSLKAASSNCGTICPRAKKPSSPPWSFEPGSLECSLASCGEVGAVRDLLEDLARLVLALDQDVAGAHLLLGLRAADLAVVELLGFRVVDGVLDGLVEVGVAQRAPPPVLHALVEARRLRPASGPRRRRQTAGSRSGTRPARAAWWPRGREPRSLPISASASFMSASVMVLPLTLAIDAVLGAGRQAAEQDTRAATRPPPSRCAKLTSCRSLCSAIGSRARDARRR